MGIFCLRNYKFHWKHAFPERFECNNLKSKCMEANVPRVIKVVKSVVNCSIKLNLRPGVHAFSPVGYA